MKHYKKNIKKLKHIVIDFNYDCLKLIITY